MLNDHERFVLDEIEHELYDDDPEFATAFRAGRCPRARRLRHWPSLLLIAAGLAVVVGGLVGGITPLLVEGLVVALAGFGYNRWQVRVAADRPARRARPGRLRPGR
jgi:hypothetical protein